MSVLFYYAYSVGLT